MMFHFFQSSFSAIYCNLGGFGVGKPSQWGPSHELDHLELFAGDCSVTKGEVQDGGKGQKNVFKFRLLKHSWELNLLLIHNVLFVYGAHLMCRLADMPQ